MRVTIAHEWLVRFAGSERCVQAMLRAFPDATLLTTLLDPAAVPDELRIARTSPLQRIPAAPRHHEWLLPLMPLAWKAITPPDADLVISSSHACAKAVRVPSNTPHLCYCHTPMRYAWDFEAEQRRFPPPLRGPARLGMSVFREWDRRTAARVTHFVANSTAVADRIRRFYGRSSEVIHPPVRTDFFTPGAVRGDFFLYVGRLVSYKRPELVVEAFADLDYPLLVVGDGHLSRPLRATASANVTFVGEVDDERLRHLYRAARAIVYPADEDFGITMAEAQSCGTPVIGLRRGGAVDIVRHETTGWLIDTPETGALRAAIREVAARSFSREEIRANALRFSEERFVERIGATAHELVDRGASSRSAQVVTS